jgi:hypothetical protein
LDLTAGVGSEFGGIKDGHRADAAAAGLQGAGKLGHTPGDGIDGPQSGDNDPILLHTPPTEIGPRRQPIRGHDTFRYNK